MASVPVREVGQQEMVRSVPVRELGQQEMVGFLFFLPSLAVGEVMFSKKN